jgi:hypothetical protein
MKIYKKYTVNAKAENGVDKAGCKKFKKVPEIRRVEVDPETVIKEYIGDSCYIENQVSKLGIIVGLLLTLSREDALKKMIEDLPFEGFMGGNWRVWEWEFEE